MAVDKVQITVLKKPVESSQGHVGGDRVKSEGLGKMLIYNLTFQNQTLADLSQLKVEYAIFIERPKLGQRAQINRTNGGSAQRLTPRPSICSRTGRYRTVATV